MTAKHWSRRPLLGAVLLGVIVFGSPALAGPYEDGMRAYVGEDYATALTLLKPLAEQGDARAQYQVGVIFGDGLVGDKPDDAAAADWFGKAAATGHHTAEKTMGDIYFLGKGVTKDFVQAGRWYRKAADAGHPEAQFMLGYLYQEGLGVPKDKATAIQLYRTAEDQGYQIGDVLLGLQ